MGPTTKTISLTGGITFDELTLAYEEQAAGLVEGGADVLLLETSQDTLNVKAGLEGIDRAFAELGQHIPVAVQGTIEAMGPCWQVRMLKLFTPLCPSRPAMDRVQLCYRPRVHDRPYQDLVCTVPLPSGMCAQRWTA